MSIQSISLKDRLAQRRQELQADRTFDLAVPGYEDLLVARYRPLGYRELRKIYMRHEKETDQVQAELNIAADVLITACQAVLAKNDDGSEAEIGKWNVATAVEQFGVEFPDPAQTTARQALFQCLSEDNVVKQFAAWSEQNDQVGAEVDEAVQGESEPSHEG